MIVGVFVYVLILNIMLCTHVIIDFADCVFNLLFMKKLYFYFKIPLIIIIVLALFKLLAPHYLSIGLTHLYADLDDYKIFDNTTVEIGKPQAWKLADNYNTYSLSDEDRAYLENHETSAYLVIQNGEIIFEEYWDGYGLESYSNIFSATKSIVALLIGIAIDEGKIKSVDQEIASYFTEFANDDRGKITIKDLLTMSSGLDWNEAYESPFSITTKAYYGNKLREVTSQQSLINKPGVSFRYQSGNTQLLSFILEKATGITISEYAAQKLWIPLGANHKAIWSLDKENGDEKAFCCFNTNARDFARFGQLVLNNGMWNGNQLVPSTFIKTATSPATYLLNGTKDAALNYYGYQYWILPYHNSLIPYMRGHRGQYVYSIRDKNAVVVRMGNLKDKIHKGPITIDIPKYIDIAEKMLE